MAKCIVDCDTCDTEHKKLIPSKDITLVCNQTSQTWTYTYLCDGCGRRQVHPLSDEGYLAMQSLGANILVTKTPFVSYHTGGDVICEADVEGFQNAMREHDYLAAYAEF